MRGTGKVCECLCSRAAHARGRAGARRQKNKKKQMGKMRRASHPTPPHSTNECGRSLFDKKKQKDGRPGPPPAPPPHRGGRLTRVRARPGVGAGQRVPVRARVFVWKKETRVHGHSAPTPQLQPHACPLSPLPSPFPPDQRRRRGPPRPHHPPRPDGGPARRPARRLPAGTGVCVREREKEGRRRESGLLPTTPSPHQVRSLPVHTRPLSPLRTPSPMNS